MSGHYLHIEFELRGIVQGVGFRPAVHRLASKLGLGGTVTNEGGVVSLALEGEEFRIAEFIGLLPQSLPPQARLESITELRREECPRPPSAFSIGKSSENALVEISFPPDLRTCRECFEEVSNPSDRRYRYPFTTCTQCGPRFTVIDALPYDRERTTLRKFPLCEKCRDEYQDPAGRRFHAESIACPVCGPRLSLFDHAGRPLSTDPLQTALEALSHGEICAVRGIGGYLLVADALNVPAVTELRKRKDRPAKPFAVCAPKLDVVRRFCRVSAAEARLLEGPEGPIVILELKSEYRTHPAFTLLSPETGTLGVMLPTSPLHLLLFGEPNGDGWSSDLLVMTSGNRRSEPICISDQEAFCRLEGIADLYVSHDREINLRADDSVAAQIAGEHRLWRKARGYAPHGLTLNKALVRNVLGLGAELKNTISVGGERVILSSPHIGDLDTPEAADYFEQMVRTYLDFYRITPAAVAVDLHPDLRSTVFGADVASREGLELVRVQHHHAHAAAVMAEYGLDCALGLVFDGTGFGTDGTIWGSELLLCQAQHFERLAYFEAVPLPGGDKAVLEPRRQLVARAACAGIALPAVLTELYAISEEEEQSWIFQAERGLNAPRSSGAGRVFDSFSAALGLAPMRVSYDGQAAVSLETAARKTRSASFRLPITAEETAGKLVVKWGAALERVLKLAPGGSKEELAYVCHAALCDAALSMIDYGRAKYSNVPVVISGGCFMNKVLTEMLTLELGMRRIPAYLPRLVPPNDGGISVGQVYAAGSGPLSFNGKEP